MRKEDIVKVLQKNDSTLLSFPDRGPWGDSRYRGNCSGYIQAFLLWKYQVEKMAELFAGSGTGYDVCRDMGVNYVGADLNPLPCRPGILNVNALLDEVPKEFLGADLIFMHPPYGKEINIPYAGSMYKDPTGDLSKADLGQMPWDKFIPALNSIIMKYYSAMDKGSRMAILMGDVRRNGKCYSMLKDIVQPGQLDQIIIKAQHNCVSDGREYTHKNFVPIVHEYIMVIKKLLPYMIDFSLPLHHELDIRDSQKATWRDVVLAALNKCGKKATLSQIYEEIEGHKKCQANINWQAKVRQILQMYAVPCGNGVWQVA